MPLTRKGEKILGSMKKQYGGRKGKRVFYASQNKGTIRGTHRNPSPEVFTSGTLRNLPHAPEDVATDRPLGEVGGDPYTPSGKKVVNDVKTPIGKGGSDVTPGDPFTPSGRKVVERGK